MDLTSAKVARRLAGDLWMAAKDAAALADEAVYDATRTRTRAQVAAELGVSVGTVKKACMQHLARRRALTVGTDSDMANGADAA